MKYSRQHLDDINNHSVKIGLHPSLIDFPRTEEQAAKLLELQEMAEGHYKDTLEHMEQYGFNNPQEVEVNAFKHLQALIDYCGKFTEPNAYEALKQLKRIKLPLATDQQRYKKQQMKTWVKEDLDYHLVGFTNIKQIKTALLALSPN